MLGDSLRRSFMCRSSFPFPFVRALIALAAMLIATSASARHGDPPYSLIHGAKIASAVPTIDIGTIDAAAERAAAEAKRQATAPTKRLATARGFGISLASDRDGLWRTLADGSQLWRLRVRVAGATDLRVAFASLLLPRGATLHVIGANGDYQGPYTEADSDAAGFRSPPVPGDAATIELRVPAGADASIELIRVEAGFRDLFKAALYTGPGESGACNVNVVCPLGDPYRNEIRAAAYYEFVADDDHATYICTGTLVADVPRDHRNYFLTAAHCVASASEARSMVVYWNYQSTACNRLGQPSGGYFNDDQHAATLRATRADADFTLVELVTAPDPAWDVYYAGWDATGAEPSGTIGIHHPSGDVKKITSGPAPGTIDNCIGTGGSSVDTHWETGPYRQGTTEGGSSGSALFVATGSGSSHDKRVIGILSGGYAACSTADPSQPNDETDCYGKLASAWNGPGASSRLRDWLDPAGSGALAGDGIDSSETAPAPGTRRGHSRHRQPADRPRTLDALRASTPSP
jgi:V8-like Glu-specific endopeptidase